MTKNVPVPRTLRDGTTVGEKRETRSFETQSKKTKSLDKDERLDSNIPHDSITIFHAIRFLFIKVLDDVFGIHHSDDGIEAALLPHVVIDEEGLCDRRRIRESSSLYQDRIKLDLTLEQLFNDVNQVTSDSAAVSGMNDI